jgi:hypothetical protein
MARNVLEADYAVRAVEIRGDLVAGLRIEDVGRGKVFVLPGTHDVSATQLGEPVRDEQVRVGIRSLRRKGSDDEVQRARLARGGLGRIFGTTPGAHVAAQRDLGTVPPRHLDPSRVPAARHEDGSDRETAQPVPSRLAFARNCPYIDFGEVEEVLQKAQSLIAGYDEELARELPEGAEIFDAHVHLGHDIDGMTGVYEDLERIGDQYGISRCFMFCMDEPDRHPSFRAANDRTLEAGARSDGRLIPFDTYNLFYRDDLERTRLAPLRRQAEAAWTGAI